MRNWVKDAVVYQIYPKSFKDSNGDGIGDLQGIISKLDYLSYLGINVIWLCPIYKSGGVDGGYDIADYKNIEEQFGSLEDFQELLKKAHEKNIKVIMDLVVNHTSDKHAYFLNSKSSKNSEKSDWYIWREPKEDGSEPCTIPSVFSGSAWQFDKERQQYYLHLFAKGQPDLNWDNKDVRSDVFSMMSWWMDKGIDGFRMDVISVISKTQNFLENGGTFYDSANGPNLHKYLKEMNEKVLSKYDVMTVGEAPCTSIEEAKLMVNESEKELDMIFNFDHVSTEDNENGKWNINRYSMPRLREILSSWQYGLQEGGWNSLFWGNHDQPRLASRFGDDSTILTHEKSSKMLATCLYCLKGTPYIYQGDEIGMTNVPLSDISECEDIESINAFNEFVKEKGIYSEEEMMDCIRSKGRDNARTPVQWNSSKNCGFSDNKPWMKVNPNFVDLNVEKQKGDNNSILQYYRKLISLRKQMLVLRDGDFNLLLENDENIFAYERKLQNSKAIVICNFTNKNLQINESLSNQIDSMDLALSNYVVKKSSELRPYEARLYNIC